MSSLFWSVLFFCLGKPLQCGYYYSPKFQRRLSQADQAGEFDKYVAHLIRMVPYVDTKKRRSKTIVEMTDALSKTYSLSAKAKGAPLKKMVYRWEQHLVEKYEGYVIKAFPKVVLVSSDDKDYLEKRFKGACDSVAVHTNGVDCAGHTINSYKKNKICFIGNMRTLQNQDAVLYFLESIFPVIRGKMPGIQFHIIGAEPPEHIQSLHDGKNVFVTGFVEDIGPVVSDSAIAVAPVRIAAGIQNKVLISMGYGIPVVMTSLISGAIPELVHGINCLIADEPESFASSCLDLLFDGKKGTALVNLAGI